LADQAYTLLKAAPKGEGYLYSPNCLEDVFSETQFPALRILGNCAADIKVFLF